MFIIVVKTCDGDVYFSKTERKKVEASELAADQVLHHNIGDWDEEDKVRVHEAITSRDYKKLWKVLLDIQAIRVEEVR